MNTLIEVAMFLIAACIALLIIYIGGVRLPERRARKESQKQYNYKEVK